MLQFYFDNFQEYTALRSAFDNSGIKYWVQYSSGEALYNGHIITRGLSKDSANAMLITINEKL